MALKQKPVVYWVDQADLSAFDEPRQSYAPLVHTADEGVADLVAQNRPYARVCLLRIQPRGIGDFLDGMSRPLPGRPDRVERLLLEHPIYDLGTLGKAMCLAVGRNADSHFKPLVDLTQRFFTQPHPAGLGYKDDMDTAVSREHAWIVYPGGEDLLYVSVGTRENPGNGALYNDDTRVRASTHPWMSGDFFGVGQVCKNAADARPPFLSIFRLRYQILTKAASETIPEGG